MQETNDVCMESMVGVQKVLNPTRKEMNKGDAILCWADCIIQRASMPISSVLAVVQLIQCRLVCMYVTQF